MAQRWTTLDLSQVSGGCSLAPMSTVAEIKAAISRLTLEERAEVARCLHEWEDDAWDEQIREDLAAGKLDTLLAKVDDDIDQAKLRDLP
jgi:ribosome recycling factor